MTWLTEPKKDMNELDLEDMMDWYAVKSRLKNVQGFLKKKAGRYTGSVCGVTGWNQGQRLNKLGLMIFIVYVYELEVLFH